jgi:dipeptidyl aminopeptidase/acylaminoacyl peptidase
MRLRFILPVIVATAATTIAASAIRWMMKMGGSPDAKPDVYRKANSLADVAKIKAPLLIMHGEDDPQVPPYESAQFVNDGFGE